jgi:hypothetical protein
MTCNPHSVGRHGYIIVYVDYFTKWAEVMPTFDNTEKTKTLFIFNHIITRFSVPQSIIIDQGSHFQNFMMSELTEKLGLLHENLLGVRPKQKSKVILGKKACTRKTISKKTRDMLEVRTTRAHAEKTCWPLTKF